MLVDCHCHIISDQFEGEVEQIIQRAKEAGVEKMIVAGSPSDAEKILKLCNSHEGLYASFGIGSGRTMSGDEFRELLEWLYIEKHAVAVGEAGLDYLRDPNKKGRDVFLHQASFAADSDWPLIVHSREAHSDTLAILQAANCTKGMIHSFSYGVEEAEQYLEQGFYLSFSGMVCRSSFKHLREVVRMMPLNRILVETDSPYLSPNPAKYRRNEPSLLPRIVKQIAKWRKEYPEVIALETAKNAERLFGL